MKAYKKMSGFTILEVLVVLLVVGILASVAIYSLNLSRASNRDSKRISDISVIRASLTQYWLQNAVYPTSEAVDLGRPGAGADKLAKAGFVAKDSPSVPVFLDQVPTGPKAGEYYRYKGSSKGYSLRFSTERTTAYGEAGIWYAHSGGIDKEDVEK
ncbi:MAG: prepilin-type N-terminal cleavage/methylation domain-containing protein [Patescibacteria group bacterium]